jgi:ribulose-phosphate 3-epimerase
MFPKHCVDFMKISASIYSDQSRPLKAVIEDLVDHQVDMLHVDCNDDLSVFEDIRMIREWCDIPVDLHIITTDPSKYFDLLRLYPVDYVTFQFEDLSVPLEIPSDISGKKGLAITTPTSVDVFEPYNNFDFILIMATVPGKSGGVFDRHNFHKIRRFRKLYPDKSIHVDGGVNGEVSFILRNMGVSSSVSGSYLFKGPSIGHALMNLTKRSIESHFQVVDFMTPLSESPVVYLENIRLSIVLETIELGQVGFCLVVEKTGKLAGLISSADIRKGLLKNIHHPSEMNPLDIINRLPIVIQEKATVLEMLTTIKRCSFPIMYLPVVDKDGKATGIINFVHLIKAEL